MTEQQKPDILDLKLQALRDKWNQRANASIETTQSAPTEASPSAQIQPQQPPQTQPEENTTTTPTEGGDSTDDTGLGGTLLDIGKGALAGAYDAVAETVNLGSDAINLFRDEGDKIGDFMDSAEENFGYTPQTLAGGLAKSISQFAAGFIGAGKFLKTAKLLQGTGKAATVGRGMAEGALADFTVFDANEERLSNLIQSCPAVANPITDFLAAKEDDPAVLGRLKNTIEGMGLGLAGEALVVLVKGMKTARTAKTVAEAEDAVVQTGEELKNLQGRSTAHETGVTGLSRANQSIMDSADFKAAKTGNEEAASRIVDQIWTEKQTQELTAKLDPNKETVFISVPSSSGANKLPDALGKKLEAELGGKFLDSGFTATAPTEMKFISPTDRPFAKRGYTPTNDELLQALKGKQIVVVEDILTTGASARQFITALRKEGIDVTTVAGLMGDARIDAPPQLVDKLQRTLRNAGMDVKGKPLAQLLSKGEIQVLIQRINKAGSNEERTELAARLQGLLNERASGTVGQHPATPVRRPGSSEREGFGNERPSGELSSGTGALGLYEGRTFERAGESGYGPGQEVAGSLRDGPGTLGGRGGEQDSVVDDLVADVSEVMESGGKVELNVREITPEDALSAALPAEKGVATRAAPLKTEDMQKLVARAISSGKSTADEVANEIMIGNTGRISFNSPDELALHKEIFFQFHEQTLKGKGVETHQEILNNSAEWMESMSLQGVLDAAAHDRETMQSLAVRAETYKSLAKTYGQKFLDLEQQIALHGSSDALLKELEHVNRVVQDLSLASKDITTASARVTSAGKINAPYLSLEQTSAILKAADGDPEKFLRIQNMMKRGRLGRLGHTIKEIVINGLLSSPKTHFANIGGNFLKAALMPADKMLGGVYMGDSRIVREGAETYFGLFKYLGESWKAAKMAAKMGDNILDRGHQVMDARHQPILGTYEKIKEDILLLRIAKGGDSTKELTPLEELQARAFSFLGFPSRALIGADEWFKQINYRANIHGKLMAEAMTKFGNDTAKIQDFVERGMREAFEVSGRGTDAAGLRYGQEATWTQALKDDAYFNGGLGQGFYNLVNQYPPLRLVMPFIRTPTNLIRDFVAHTPGLNMLTKRFKDAVAEGGERKAQAIGAMATGTMLWTSAIGLAYSGRMTGGYPKDPATRQAWIDSGIEPYSFRIGDTYISFARMDPFATFFGIAADYAEYSRNWNDSAKGNFVSGAILSLGNNLLSKSYLTGLTDLIDALGDSSVDSKAMQRYVQRSVTMFIPYSSGLRFTRQLADDSMREVRAGFDGILDTLQNTLPGASTLLPERRSWITGKAIPYNTFWGEHKDDVVANELARLGDNLDIGAPSRRYKGVLLDGNQYSRLCELQGSIKIGGQTQHERLAALMKSASYDLDRRSIPDSPGDLDNPRTVLVEKVIREYRKAAQKAILREDSALREAADKEQKTRIAARRGDAAQLQQLLTMPR